MSVYEKTFTLKDEDHTIGNAVRYMLNKNPQVSLAGYSVPHPMETSVNVRVQTTGEVTATAAMRDALLDIVSVCDHVHDTFDAAVEDFKAKNPAPMDVASGEEEEIEPTAGLVRGGRGGEGVAILFQSRDVSKYICFSFSSFKKRPSFVLAALRVQ